MSDDAVQVAVAKAVTATIAAADLGVKFTPERSYADWELSLSASDLLELRDEDKLHVDVVAHTTQQRTELTSRGVVKYIVPVDIAIRRKFGMDKQNDDTGRVRIEELDTLVKLVEDIHLLFTPQRLTDFQYAVWDGESGGTNIVVNPDQKLLREKRQFTGIVRIFFRADVSL